MHRRRSIFARPWALGVLGGAMALAASRPAAAAPDWVGDFETADLSQWTLSPQVIGNLDHLTVTQRVVFEGQHAGRIQLDPADTSPSGHNRNELVYSPPADTFEGSERWYSIALRPEQAWADSWHLVLYWEGNPVYASVMSMVVVGPQLQFRTFLGGETQQWAGAFTPGVWQELILHVHWSPDPDVGFVELLVDGEVVVPVTHVATMHGPGVPNELHTGILRDDAIDVTEVLYVDGVRAGATMEDVMNEPAGGSEGGEGSSDGGPTDDGGGATSTASGGTGAPDGSGGADAPGDGDRGPDQSSSGGSGSADDGDGGCGCRSAGHGPARWLWSMLALGGGARARRRRREPSSARARDGGRRAVPRSRDEAGPRRGR